MKLSVKKIFGISRIDEELVVKSSTFLEGKTCLTLETPSGKNLQIYVSEAEFLELMSDGVEKKRENPSRPSSRKSVVTKAPTKSVRSRTTKDKEGVEVVEEKDLNMTDLVGKGTGTGTGDNIVKKTRRIRCPKSGEMIESEQYHLNKRNGLYTK